MQTDAQFVVRAAWLRDELHVVTNRVARLLVAPGSDLSIVTLAATAPLAAADVPGGVTVALLRRAAERLARVVESLGADEWERRGASTTEP